MAEEKKVLSTIKKEDNGNIVLTVTIPQVEVKKVWEQEIESTVKNAELPGFRKGQAPRKLVEEKLETEKITEEVLKKLLPNAYIQAVEEHKINPIVNPKIHVDKIGMDADWVFTAITCEVPEIKLGKYKEAIQKITQKSKIIIPGKEEEAKGPSFDDIVKVLLETITATIPQVLMELEVERQLAQLLGEIKKLGLTLDQYLASSGKKVEDLKKDYEEKVKSDIVLEFALQKIADEEKINVDQKELDEALLKAKDDTERQQLQANMYLLANILKQQKTLDFLKNL